MKLNLRQSRPAGRAWKWALVALIPLVLAVGAASAAPGTDLVDPDVRFSDSFYPCPGQTDFSRGPLVSECLDGSFQRLRPAVVSAYSCDPDGTSTIEVSQRTSGDVFIFGGGWLAGALTWELTATIGPQDRAAVPFYQPLAGDGAPVGSHGLPTGALTSYEGTFTIDPFDASPDISGTLALTANDGNWGVCRDYLDQPSGSPNIGGGVAPVTGEVFVLNAGVATYEVTAGPAALLGETGVAESFLMNSFVTCCNSTGPTQVNVATGHFKHQFGTTHPAEGTSGSAATGTGSNVTVSDFQGLDQDVGGVSVTFAGVGSAGDTSVTLLTSAPTLPEGFQVGDPPAFYEISTTAGGITPPITVCLGYGSLPAGTEPALLHYEDGAWVDVTTSDSGPPENEVCGEVDSLSPFAAVFAPRSATDNIGETKSALAALTTPRNVDKLEDVVEKLDKALAKLAQSPPDRQGAAGELEGAAGDLQSAVRSRLLTQAQADPALTLIAGAARILAEDAIADAVDRGGNARKIQEAEAALAAGDARLVAGRFKDAVARYKDAIAKADGA